MTAIFLQLRDWVNTAGLLLMLSAAACATPPAPQVSALPPGQARIWFYRLWDPSESLNVANIDVNGAMWDRLSLVALSIATLPPASTISCPRTSTSTII